MTGYSRHWLVMGCITLGWCGIGHAQTDVTALLKRGLGEALLGMKPVPEKERNEVLAVVAGMLQTKIVFREDGTAASVHHLSGGTTQVEWKDFKVRSLTEQGVTEADRANGITRRYQVGFGCSASREWRAKAGGWTEWRPTGYLLFPSAVTVEETNGALRCALGEQGRFLPGPGNSLGSGAIRPADKQDGDLPPGMKRAGR